MYHFKPNLLFLLIVVVVSCKKNQDIEWIHIDGGTFMMGSNDNELTMLLNTNKPQHKVNILPFDMSKSEITVAQYRKCLNEGICSEPDTDASCNYTIEVGNRENHPINCIDWKQARVFAQWIGGDLPNEAQWEYAARSRGLDIKYPWGNQKISCQYAVITDMNNLIRTQSTESLGCGLGGTNQVCSKIPGNTHEGLCDMIGNVSEWILDEWHDSYQDAPLDGSTWCFEKNCLSVEKARVIRGGNWDILGGSDVMQRSSREINHRSFRIGFRVVKKNI